MAGTKNNNKTLAKFGDKTRMTSKDKDDNDKNQGEKPTTLFITRTNNRANDEQDTLPTFLVAILQGINVEPQVPIAVLILLRKGL